MGSSAIPPWPRISKWRCGPRSLDCPPTWPMICPLTTRSPYATAAGPLESGDPVVQAFLVALQLRQALGRFPRAAARLRERGLAGALEREVALQLVGPLVLAAAQGVACVDQRLALARDPALQLGH